MVRENGNRERVVDFLERTEDVEKEAHFLKFARENRAIPVDLQKSRLALVRCMDRQH